MTRFNPPKPRRVLIASSHPLFGQGLRRLLQERYPDGVEVVGMVSNLEQAISSLERLNPDLIIVDYDDKALSRDEFLARFVEGEKKLRVVLLSLQSAGEAIVYDRRTLAASQIDNWLEEWTYADDIGSLLGTPRGASGIAAHRRSDMKHLIIAAVLVVLVAALLIVGLEFVQLLPIQASAQAVTIDWLFDLEFKVIAFLFSLIVVFMVYSMVVFRRKKGDLTDGPHIEGSNKLEAAWTIAPLATVLFFAFLGGQNLAQTVRADPRALEVRVVGQQWAWRFEYLDSGVVSNELRLPVNKQALLHLTSTDVIHSFWVPEFRVKQDALPGGQEFVRDLRVTPTQAGEWKVRCAELCGLNHAYMEAPVIVLPEDEFTAWINIESGVSNDPVERGQKWYTQFGCNACHSLDGTRLVGPTWQGLYGRQEVLQDGSTVTADEAYLLESIHEPGVKLVEGFPNVMPPNIDEQMTEEQIADIIEFIKSLE